MRTRHHNGYTIKASGTYGGRVARYEYGITVEGIYTCIGSGDTLRDARRITGNLPHADDLVSSIATKLGITRPITTN